MKQKIIKTIYIGFFYAASMMTTHCFAQEADDAMLKMMPEIPSEITDPSQRATYLINHFWDKFNFKHTSLLMADHLLERCFVEYLDLLSLVPDDIRDQSIQSFMKKSEEEPDIFSFVLQISEHYLYDPESPVSDDEKLIPFLQYALQSALLDDGEKFRLSYLLDCISINNTGSIANDFSYSLMNGEKGTLHAIRADYTLLYFNDPECDDCRMLIRQLTGSPLISQYVQSGQLKIITVYVNDDLEAWKKHANDVLHTWIYAYDAEQTINNEIIYNIKQFPALYLLDKDKKVILKELNFDTLEEYFRSSQLITKKMYGTR